MHGLNLKVFEKRRNDEGRIFEKNFSKPRTQDTASPPHCVQDLLGK